ncbi:flavin reductase [Bradyrhizobium sp. USDA 4486]
MLEQTNGQLAAGTIPGVRPIDDVGCSECVSANEFREALSKLATPVSIVATNGPHGIAGFTCSAVCSITDDPPTIMVCANRKSYANSIIKANGVLCVSSLSADQVALSQMFAGVGQVSMPERFVGSDWGVLTSGAPYCKLSRVALDCRVADVRDVGSHSIILAEVLSTVHATNGEPLIYHSRNYATIRHVA